MHITCHCGAVKQDLQVQSDEGLILCHCNECRHSTGLLCTTYVIIQVPPSLDGTRSYPLNETTTLHFCGTCGCHVFRATRHGGGDGEVVRQWAVASGVVVNGNDSGAEQEFKFTEHANVEETKDGGLSIWLVEIGGALTDDAAKRYDEPVGTRVSSTELEAQCHCGGVRFDITRPDETSRMPVSNFPDLMIPYLSQTAGIQNPDDVKWWLRDDGTKYLAGTCACKSCRLTSGFEIQTWTFVPRANILLHARGPPPSAFASETRAPLDFAAAHAAQILQPYESSAAAVVREFCPICGATVFWHDRWRPELVDVSVGLLRADEGARAASWLDWWTERVSFAEDAARDRCGAPALWAESLVSTLERGLQNSRK
jgi:hypothetical protein